MDWVIAPDMCGVGFRALSGNLGWRCMSLLKPLKNQIMPYAMGGFRIVKSPGTFASDMREAPAMVGRWDGGLRFLIKVLAIFVGFEKGGRGVVGYE